MPLCSHSDRPSARSALVCLRNIFHVWLCVGEVFLIGLLHLLPFIGLSQQDQVAVPRLTELCRGELWFWKQRADLAAMEGALIYVYGEIDGVGMYVHGIA